MKYSVLGGYISHEISSIFYIYEDNVFSKRGEGGQSGPAPGAQPLKLP